MEDFEKLEVIVRSLIADYKKKIERAGSVTHSVMYVNDLESELKGFETILTRMKEIEKGAMSVSDEVIRKLNLPQVK